MTIKDGKMTVELPADDPRAIRIRAILFEQPAAAAPVEVLWRLCTDAHRQVLIAIARAGEIAQPALERTLGISSVELRGRHGGLARLCKRAGIAYPIQSAGGRRESRRFSLRTGIAREVLKLGHSDGRRTR